MKTQLTKEESQHLIDLGVPKEQANHFIKTDTYDGLTEENVEQAIIILQDETTD